MCADIYLFEHVFTNCVLIRTNDANVCLQEPELPTIDVKLPWVDGHVRNEQIHEVVRQK